VLAAADVLDLFADEFTGLGRRPFPLLSVASGTSDRLFRWHVVLPTHHSFATAMPLSGPIGHATFTLRASTGTRPSS
jgi:hypothetical protein